MNCSKNELTHVKNNTFQEIEKLHETYSFLHCLLPSELTDSNISSNKTSENSSALEINKQNQETIKNNEIKQYIGLPNLNKLPRNKNIQCKGKNIFFKRNRVSSSIFKLTSIYSRITKTLSGATKDLNENTLQPKDSILKRRKNMDSTESKNFYIKFFSKKMKSNCEEKSSGRKAKKAEFLIKNSSFQQFSKKNKIKKVRFHKHFIKYKHSQRNHSTFLHGILKICVRNSALGKSSKFPKEAYIVRNFEEEEGSETRTRPQPTLKPYFEDSEDDKTTVSSTTFP